MHVLVQRDFYFFAAGWVARSPVPPPSPTGEVARRARRGLQCSVAFCSAAPPSGANLLQTCHLRGLPGPGPRVTFWPARKSPKSRLREGGFRFPPSLKNPFPLKRPRPGAAAPALDPPPQGAGRGPGGRPLSHGCAVPAPPQGEPRVRCAPGERQRKEKQGAFWFVPNFCHACHLVQNHLVEARVHLRLHQSLFFSSTPGRSSSSPRRRRGGGRKLDKAANLRPGSE